MRSWFAGLLLASLAALGAHAEKIYFVAPHWGIEERDLSQKDLPAGAPQLTVTQNGLTFRVFFADIIENTGVGFDSNTVGASARARFEDALRYIGDVLNENGTLDILVTESETDGNDDGPLAFAGTFYSGTPGFQRGSTLTRLDEGSKPFNGNEEIGCTVDFGFDWNFDTGPPANNEADFQSVILHELTHGLGFASLSSATGSSRIASGVYAVYDQLMRRRTGNKVLFSGNPPSFQGLSSDLRSNDLMFFGANADALYSEAERPPLFSPNPFQPGSSLSHWETGNIVGGAVMEHAITLGVQRREFAPLEIGALIDIGYTNAADPGASPANLSISPPGPINFGNVAVGQVANQSVTLTNNGGTATSGTATIAAPFSVVAGANYNLAPGASTTVTVRFTPTILGAAAGTLTLTGDPDANLTVNLSGTGTVATPGNLTISPSGAVNFGNVLVGAQANLNFTVTNNGGTAINGATATVNGAPFTVTAGANFNLAPGANTVVTVRFSPTTAGAATPRTLSVTGDPDGPLAVTLNGTGTNTPGNLTTTPNIAGGITFTDTEEGAFTESTFTLTNNGGSAISGNASTTGAAFSIVAGAAYTLGAGESIVVRVRFTASAAEDFTGTLTLTGDPDGAIVAILEGSGIKAGNAACSAVKGHRNSWSLADGLIVALCLGALAFATPRAARVRSYVPTPRRNAPPAPPAVAAFVVSCSAER